MEFLADGLSAVTSLFTLAMILGGVMKLFQIHTVLTEIKDSLKNGSPVTAAYRAPVPAAPAVYAPSPAASAPVAAPSHLAHPTALHAMGSGEEMLRAIDAELQFDPAHSRNPEIVNPR